MKKTIKYIIIFIVTVLILFLLLVVTALIPREKIEDNIRESTETFYYDKNKKILEKTEVLGEEQYEYRHIYADAMLLNIIYYIDTSNPIESIMEAKYYSEDGEKQITYDFNKMIDEQHEANVQYIRYWHGSMSVIRPLLTFLNLNQIYVLNAIILLIGTIILIIIFIKYNLKELAIAYILGLIMCTAIVVPFCLEYYWTFLIMTIVSILSIILYKKGKNLNTLFMITGIITCYFDFLSTELITILVPVLIILTISYKENKISNFKNGFKFLIISIIFWCIGYIGMWISKWILASIILKINALDYVINDMLFRINGTGNPERTILARATNLPLRAVDKNIRTIFPIQFLINQKVLTIVILCIIITEIIFIRKKDIKKLWFSGLLLIISIIPYIRYLILASHSFSHYFFTFRAQIVTIIGIVLAIIYSIDEDIAKIEINRKKKH